MSQAPKPRILFSRCLGFDNCRYDSVPITDRAAELLAPFVEPITVFPQVAIGLGVPRPPIRLIEEGDRTCLCPPETGRDLTKEMAGFSREFLDSLGGVDGFLLKRRSPSCGPRQVKVYDSRRPNAGHRKGAGAFAAAVIERFPNAALEDEGRLQNFRIPSHYLTKVFALARFRPVLADGSMGALVGFHAQHKLLLMAYNQQGMRAMGRLVANAERLPTSQVIAAYRPQLIRALAKSPRHTSAVNVLQHAFGFVSGDPSSRERKHFLSALAQYSQSRIPPSAVAVVMRPWIVRFDVECLADQVYFEPYTLGLIEILDSGKERVA